MKDAREVWRARRWPAWPALVLVFCGIEYNISHLACLDPPTEILNGSKPDSNGAAYDGHLVVANGQQRDFALVRMDTAGYDERGRVRPLGGQTSTAARIGAHFVALEIKSNVPISISGRGFFQARSKSRTFIGVVQQCVVQPVERQGEEPVESALFPCHG